MRTHLFQWTLAGLLVTGLVACSDDDSTENNNNNNETPATCGDDTAEGTETCDGADLRMNDCTSIGQNFTSGTLACNATCDGWDTTACVANADCGNGSVDTDEACDGANLLGYDCTTMPGSTFTGGTLGCLADCSDFDTSMCESGVCGNDTIEDAEVCDGADLDSYDCTTVPGGSFTGGTLDCLGDCSDFDTTGCITSNCGDDTIDGGELCDGLDLDSNDCTTIGMGYTGGTLACDAGCMAWDTSACTAAPVCGDGNLDTGELCDGAALGGNNCTTLGLGFTGGTLACNGTCDDWDTTGCNSNPVVCGDGSVGLGELCDGADLDGNDCTTLGAGFSGGTLACNANCQLWDVSQCTLSPAVCGNNVTEGFEQCDGTDTGGTACTDFGFTGGTIGCTADCQIDLTTCTGGQPGWTCPAYYYAASDGCDCGCGVLDPDCADATAGSCEYCNDAGSCNGYADCTDPGNIINATNNAICDAATCGNGVAEAVELCDGADVRGLTCADIGMGFVGGTLACDASCGFDTSGCTAAVCGDGTVGGYEWCDGADLGGYDCASLGMGYVGGTLACDASCNYDTSQCTMPVCGDGAAEGAEDCDGADLGGNDCTTAGPFTGGTLACDANCGFDTSQCVAPVCGDGVADNGEYCDGADLGMATGATCADIGFTGGTFACLANCHLDFSTCTGGQPGWTCPAMWYGAQDGCDCGCGIIDPDCANATAAACDYCDDPGSCSSAGLGCPGDLDPADNSQCI